MTTDKAMVVQRKNTKYFQIHNNIFAKKLYTNQKKNVFNHKNNRFLDF